MLNLIITPTIHVVVEDADFLTTEVRERVTAWLSLPEYEPNPNGDLIRAEHIHGGGEFIGVSENELEDIESRPFNCGTDQFLEPLEVDDSFHLGETVEYDGPSVKGTDREREVGIITGVRDDNVVIVDWESADSSECDPENLRRPAHVGDKPHPAVAALKKIVEEEEYDSKASHIARHALDTIGVSHRSTETPKLAPVIESGKPDPMPLRDPSEVTANGWHRIAEDVNRALSTNADAHAIEEFVTNGTSMAKSPSDIVSKEVEDAVRTTAKSYGIDTARCSA